MGGYLLLFTSAFLAATVIPFYSEVILYALIRQGESAWLLISVASIGNTLGAAVNWVLGRFLLQYQERRWFYFKPEQVAKAQRWFQRYGVWSLLFAWLPIGGDALTFIAGVMRVRFMIFIVWVGFGKTCRYIVILYLTRWSMTF
jgi:membrane protein YqaA with SNARE-associated domain